MAGFLRGDLSHHGLHNGVHQRDISEKVEEDDGWCLTRKEIEENSPSRRDGIDLKKETSFRRSYCIFLQDLGMRLKVPQVTIATAIIFCHRFFQRQSHAKNDRKTIATVCMFLAGKVEETPRPLRDVIVVSYEITHKKHPTAAQRIKQKDVYEQQKELILLGEKVVLTTLDFDMNVHHPYKPLVEAIKKFKVAQNALAQVAWNFVNDGLRTSLCLQFRPHHVAAGAIFLAAKFLKVKLPSDGEKVWWQEFDVTPRQLEEISNQILELYEQTRLPPSQGSEFEGSTTREATHQTPSTSITGNVHASASSSFHAKDKVTKTGISTLSSSIPVDNYASSPRTSHNRSSDNRGSGRNNCRDAHELKYNQHPRSKASQNQQREESENTSDFGSDHRGEHQDRNLRKTEMREAQNSDDQWYRQHLDHRERNFDQSRQEVIKKIDKDKVKAALEKQKKCRAGTRKSDLMDDDDLIERELEDGVELAAGSEKNRPDVHGSSLMSSDKLKSGESLNLDFSDDSGNEFNLTTNENMSGRPDLDNFEEGELSELGASGNEFQSPRSD